MPKLGSRRVRRLSAIVGLLILAIVCAVRLLDFQVVNAASYNKEAEGKRAVPIVIPAVRGNIVDRNGEVLATTVERYDVQLSPKNTQLTGAAFYRPDPNGEGTQRVTSREAYDEIAKITGQTGEEIEQIVDDALEKNPKSDFAYVKRGITLTQLNELKALDIPWVTYASNFSRTYPNGAVAGNITGFYGADGEPLAGVELSQNKCLAGKDGTERYERSADGVRLPGSTVITDPTVNGGTLKLTIDRDLQWQMQQLVNSQQASNKAEWSMITVMDVKTGELLAVAEDNSVDPNDPAATDPSRREARAFANPYEPGSTMKTMTLSAVVDEGLAKPTDRIQVPTRFEKDGVSFGDAYYHPEVPMTLTGVIVNSSNVGTGIFGERMKDSDRYDYLQKYGFGQKPNTGMPSESAGVVYPAKEWVGQSKYTTMFGQGLSVTPVQLTDAYQAVANGGVRIPASVVKDCTSADGTVTKFHAGEPQRVISEKTAQEMSDMLEAVVLDEKYSHSIAIPGYRLAGKSGTAQASDGQGRYRPDYISSFAGYLPADNPRYVVVAIQAFPENATHFKMWDTAAEIVIRQMQVEPSSGSARNLPKE